MKALLNLIGALAAGYVLLTLVAYLLQDRMLFFPNPLAVPSKNTVRLTFCGTETEGDGRSTPKSTSE